MGDQPLFPHLTSSGTTATNGNGAVLPDLFGESSLPKSTASEQSTVVNAVVSQSDASKERVLGPKPVGPSGLEMSSGSFEWASFLAKLSFLIAIGVFAFFYSQLQTRFEVFTKNPAQKLVALASNIQEEQTILNFYHWSLAKFALDEFSVLADSYLYAYNQYNSEWTSRNKKTELEEELASLQEEIQTTLGAVQTNISFPLYPEDFSFSTLLLPDLKNQYQALLSNYLESETQELFIKEGGPYTSDIAILEGVVRLLNATELQSELRTLDLSQPLSAETIKSLFEQATSVSTTDYVTVLTIKNGRMDWSIFLQTLEEITSEVDPLYQSDLPSYIEYSRIGFDSADKSLNLSGKTRTDDSLNFSVISDLIDALEASPLFSDVESRSFAKSANSDGFVAQFTLSLKLQEGENSHDQLKTSTDSTDTTGVSTTHDVASETPTDDTSVSSAEEETSFFENLTAGLLSIWHKFEAKVAVPARVPRVVDSRS